MGTEKFIAFKEDGSAYRLKGRILRFLDNEPVSEADKTNIRSTLSVPASAEGLTPANNLSDLDSAATARTNLEVNSKDEDAQANALKTTSPAMYFNGTPSVVTVAHDDKFSFTDGVDDLPFTVSAWINMTDATNFGVVSKYGSTNPNQEWLFYTSGADGLSITLKDASGNLAFVIVDTAVTSYEGQWIHVAATYAGSGPSSAVDFSNAADSGTMELYINGSLQTGVTRNSSSYTGMSGTAQPVNIGRYFDSVCSKGSIRDVKIFNRELTSTEVAQLARGNDLGFSEEWGGALGAVYTSDFSAGVDGFLQTNGTVAGNVDGVGGQDDNLRFTVDTSNAIHRAYKTGVKSIGKRYRVAFDYYVPSGQSNVDNIRVTETNGTDILADNLNVTDAWTRATFESVATTNGFYFYAKDGIATTFQDASGDDVFYIRNITVTEIGTLADFRSERYDTSTSKLYDISDNAFVGTGTSVTLTGREVPVYETGTWTPVFIGSSASDFTYSSQEGYYTRVGNQVTVHGNIKLSAVGTSSGAISIGGLPFTVRNTATQTFAPSIGLALAMTGLSSAITGLFSDGDTDIDLYDWTSTGAGSLLATNLTATSQIHFSGTYQIQ